MIKIDLGNALPRGIGVFLLALIPGLLFELVFAFGEPVQAHRVLDQVRQVYDFPSYALFVLFIASAFFIGHIFWTLAWFADILITFLYRLKLSFIPATLGSEWLYRTFARLQGVSPKQNLFVRSLSKMVMWGRGRKFPFNVRPVLHCERVAANQLLMRRYGLSPSKGSGPLIDLEWQAWLSVIPKPTKRYNIALFSARTFLSCALAALATWYVTPALRNHYFLFATAVLITSGTYQSWSYARSIYEPMRSSLGRLSWILTELAEIEPPAKTNKQDKKEFDEVSKLTLNIGAEEHENK